MGRDYIRACQRRAARRYKISQDLLNPAIGFRAARLHGLNFRPRLRSTVSEVCVVDELAGPLTAVNHALCGLALRHSRTFKRSIFTRNVWVCVHHGAPYWTRDRCGVGRPGRNSVMSHHSPFLAHENCSAECTNYKFYI